MMRAGHLHLVRALFLVGLAGVGGFTVLGTSGIAGAASRNGITAKPTSQIVQTALNKTTSVRSVAFVLSGTTHGQPINIEGTAGKTAGAATIMLGSGTIDVALVNNTVYFKGDESFYQEQGSSASEAAQLAGEWVSAPTSNSQFSQFDQFLLVKSLFIQAAQGSTGKGIQYTKLGNATINGTPTIKIAIRDPKKASNDGIAYVSTTGTPYLIRVAQSGSQGDTLTFSDFNEPINVEAPQGAIPAS